MIANLYKKWRICYKFGFYFLKYFPTTGRLFSGMSW